MKRLWVNKASSFKEAEKFSKKYYRAMSRTERLETVQLLREIYNKIKRPKYATGKRLRKVIRVIQ